MNPATPAVLKSSNRSATLRVGLARAGPGETTGDQHEPTNPKPTIARIWRGRTPRARADAYAAYLYEHGIRPLEAKALAVEQLREDRAEDSEFVTISYWESVEAMSASPARTPGAFTICSATPSS